MLRTENSGEPFVGKDATILRKLGTWPEKSVGGGDITRMELSQQTQTLHANCVARFVVPGLACLATHVGMGDSELALPLWVYQMSSSEKMDCCKYIVCECVSYNVWLYCKCTYNVCLYLYL